MIEDSQTDSPYLGAIHRKWGSVVSGGKAGFQAVPDILLRQQRMLGITNSELTVLLNITMYWWDTDRWPYPTNAQISKNTGMNVRSVQRAVSGLQKKGIVERVPTADSVAFNTRTHFDLSGLIEKLKPVAEEYKTIRAQPHEA